MTHWSVAAAGGLAAPDQEDQGQPRLDHPAVAAVLPAAAPHRGVQVLHRPAAGREGPRRRRPLPAPARRTPSWSAWTRSPSARPWSGPSRSCRCGRGIPERQTHDYARHGVTCLFAALNVATGQVTDACYPRHRHQEFLRFLKKVAAAYPGTRTARGLRQLLHAQARRRRRPGWRRTRGSPCTSPRPDAPGSTSWNASSPSSPARPSAAAPSPQSASSPQRSARSSTRWNDHPPPVRLDQGRRQDPRQDQPRED